MRWKTLQSGRYLYQLRTCCRDMMTKPESESDDEIDRQAVRISFFNQREAERFVMHFLKDGFTRQILLSFIFDEFRYVSSFDLNHPTDEWLAEVLGWSIEHDDVRIYRLESQFPIPLLPEVKKVPVMPPPVTNPRTWIEAQFVWDDSGEPVRGLPIVLESIDGRTSMKRTDDDGVIHLDPIEPGACQARCSFQGITLADCAVFAGTGPVKGDAKPSSIPKIAPLAVVQVEARKIKTGETLEIIAKQAGLNWRDLAFFNWGTKDSKKINEHLANEVGCTKKTKDGANYIFDDSDSPGIIYVPQRWKLSGLGTSQRHVIRVSPIERVMPTKVNILVRLQIDPTDPADTDDRFVLRDANQFRIEKTINDDLTPKNKFVDLLFEGLSRGVKYTLEVHRGEGRPVYLMFENMTYEQLKQPAANQA